QILVPVDAEIGVVAALHQDRRAAERQRLLALLEDDRPRQHVALAGVAGPAIEGAERAVGVADVRVVQVAVDDERDDPRVGAAVPGLVGAPSHSHEVARAQELRGVGVGDPLAAEGAVEDLGDAHPATSASSTNRSSGTTSSSTANAARSQNTKK